MTEAVAAMQSLRDDLHQKLLANPDYRAKIALDRAITEANGQEMPRLMNAGNMESLSGHYLPVGIRGSHPGGRPIHFFGGGEALPTGKMSQADAAYAVLKSTMRPMTTAELIEPVREMGATLGGDDPATNLSSSLSREKDRFQSLRWNRKTCWWFKDVDVPREDKPDGDADLIVAQILRRAEAVLRQSRKPVPVGELQQQVRNASPAVHFSAGALKNILIHDGRFAESPEGWTLIRPSSADLDQGDDQDPRDGYRKGRWS